MGFFALTAAWLFLLIPPLVLFYFLKLKRPRLEIPSLVLWRQVLNDNRVNSPFQRFKRNILLLLQLLLLILLVLAAMQPFWRGGSDRAGHLPILIDASASMSALDENGKQSRLDEAKGKVRQIIDGLLPDQDLCLISFGRTAHKLTGFTNNKRVLRDALDAIAVEDVASDVEDALQMTQALSRGTAFDEVLLYSDGNFPTKAEFDLSFKLNYQQLAPAGPNLGITGLNARRSGAGRWDVFVSVAASDQRNSGATVEVSQDGKVIGAEPVLVSRSKGERLMFPVSATTATSLEVRLKPDESDSLPRDNVAYLDLNPARPMDVYVPPALLAFRLALAPQKQINLFPADTSAAAAASPATNAYDLVITNSIEEMATSSAKVSMCIGAVPDDLKAMVGIKDDGTAVIDWRRTEPLLEHVELTDLVVLDDPTTAQDVRESDFESLGYEVLAYGQHGPLILRKREGQKVAYYTLFDTDRSTLPYRVAFPILLSNLVNVALHSAGLLEIAGRPTGVLSNLDKFTPNGNYTVHDPAGGQQEVAADSHGVLSGIAAPRAGYYRITGPGSVDVRVGASLLSDDETALTSVEQIQFNELSVKAAAAPIKTDRSLWKMLAIIGLVVLLLEWWVYQKRPGGIRP